MSSVPSKVRNRFIPRLELLENRNLLAVSLVPADNVNISRMNDNQAESTIAINADTSGHDQFSASINYHGTLPGTFDDSPALSLINSPFASRHTPGILAAYSEDWGTTWTQRIMATGGPAEAGRDEREASLPAASGDPQATFDSFGNLYFTYLADQKLQFGRSTSMTVNSLTDVSRSWSTYAQGTPGEWVGKIITTFTPNPAPNTNAYESYMITSYTPDRISIAPATFRNVNNQTHYQITSATINQNGQLVPANTAAVVYSDDGGQHFSFLRYLDMGSDPTVDYPSVATGPGRTAIAGEQSVWFSYRASNGKVMATGAPVTGFGQANIGAFIDPKEVSGSEGMGLPRVQVGPRGQVIVSFHAMGNRANNPAPAGIFVSALPEGLAGDRFDPRVSVASTNVIGNGQGSFQILAQPMRGINPEVSMAWDRTGLFGNADKAANGRIYMVFVRANPNNLNDTDVYYTYSDNVGQNWSTPRLVHPANPRAQFMPAISVDQTDGHIAVVWYDARDDARNARVELYGTVSNGEDDETGNFIEPVLLSEGGLSDARRTNIAMRGETQPGTGADNLLLQNQVGIPDNYWARNFSVRINGAVNAAGQVRAVTTPMVMPGLNVPPTLYVAPNWNPVPDAGDPYSIGVSGPQGLTLYNFDFGDYIGLAFHNGWLYPIWSQNTNPARDNPNGFNRALDVYTSAVEVEDDGNPVNAAADNYTVRHGTTLTTYLNQAPYGLLNNDSDSQAQTLSVSKVNGSAANVGVPIILSSGATVTVNADGTFTYAPPSNFSGSDGFLYTASNGVTSDDSRVHITVTSEIPIATDDQYRVLHDQTLTTYANQSQFGLLNNDSDPNGDSFIISQVNGDAANVGTAITLPSGATLTVQSNGSFIYVAATGSTEQDSFTYTIDNGHATATATVNITVASQALVATGDYYSVAHNQTLTSFLSPYAGSLLDNDFDLDGNPLTISAVNGSAVSFDTPITTNHGTVTLSADGSFTYKANAGVTGSDSFTYTISTGTNSATATVAIDLTNEAPVAYDEAVSTNEDVPLQITAAMLLADDVDADGDGIGVAQVSAPSHGTLVDNHDGTYTYTPGANFNGTDSFTVTVTDAFGATATATVTITVQSVNDAPVGTDNTVTTQGTTPYTFTRTDFGFTDPNDPTPNNFLGVYLASLPGAGTLTNYGVPIVNNGTFLSVSDLDAGHLVFTPAADGNAPTAYLFQVRDDGGMAQPNVDTDPTPRTMTLHASPTFTSAGTVTFAVGNAATFTPTTSGYPAPTLTESGLLPGGVTFSGGVFSGTPYTATGGSYALTLSADNGTGTAATQSFTLLVNQAPAITSAGSAAFVAGTSGSFTVSTSGFPAPTLTAAGNLPGGLSFTDHGDGTATLSGTPTAGSGGTYFLTLTAYNGTGSLAISGLALTVNEAPAITSAAGTAFVVGTSGAFTVAAGGFPLLTWTVTGTLPSGLSLTDHGDGTATLGGTPATGSGGSYSVTLAAGNGVGSAATQSFTVTVNEAPAITSISGTALSVGAAGSYTLTSSGFPAPSWSVSGTLPGGVSLTDYGNGNALLSGTPAVGSGGTYTFTLSASNGSGSYATQSFTLAVNEPAAITSADHTTFAEGSTGAYTLTTSGFPTATLTASGTLPSGVTLVDHGDGTATLSGTPAVGSGGTYTLTLTAGNGAGGNATQSFTLTVNVVVAITSAGTTTFTAGSSGAFTVTTSGFLAPTLLASGTLPSGVTFHDNGDGTGTLSGTPATGSGGTYTFTLGASDANRPYSASQTFTLIVREAVAITSVDYAYFYEGSAGTFTMTTSGFPLPSLTATGALPGGVTFVDNGDGTATLSGTPAYGSAGTYSLTITASNGLGGDVTQTFILTIFNPP